jgi:hypothetical protein
LSQAWQVLHPEAVSSLKGSGIFVLILILLLTDLSLTEQLRSETPGPK